MQFGGHVVDPVCICHFEPGWHPQALFWQVTLVVTQWSCDLVMEKCFILTMKFNTNNTAAQAGSDSVC